MTPPRERIELVVDDEVLEFDANKLTSEYDTVDSLMKDVKILSCMAALTEMSVQCQREDNRSKTYLTIKLKEQKLSWEESTFAYFDFVDNVCDIEIRLKTPVRTGDAIMFATISSSIMNSKFVLKLLDRDYDDEVPSDVHGEDGWHSWVVHLSVMPDATFGEFFRMRLGLSQEVFLPSGAITTPYLALRMVQAGQANVLLGFQESEWLECKSVAYEFKNIDEALWKHELAEDVAQFANTETGGLLLVGFRTKKKAAVDTIEKITPVPASDTRPGQYRDILKQRIHPPISRLLIEAFPWNGGQIVCIFVPPQIYENQPYLVSGSVIQGRYIRSGVTIVRRRGDGSIPITAAEIHSTLVAGRAFLRGRIGVPTGPEELHDCSHSTGPAESLI